MATGTVKSFNGPSGFGVITADEFEAREGGMGAQAIDVRSVLADDAAGGSLRDTPVTSRKEG